MDLLHLGRHLHLAQPHGHLHGHLRVQRVLGPVSAALRLLLQLAVQHGAERDLAAAVGQRVDAGGARGPHHDRRVQLHGSVLLLLRHRSLRPLAADVPQQRPGLSADPGPERLGSLHHLDVHRLPHQLLPGPPPVGRGPQHGGHGLALYSVWRADGVVHPGELGSGPLGAEHPDRLPRGDRGSGRKRLETFQPRASQHQLHLHSGAAGSGLRPAGVPGLHRHLEELQASSSLPGVGPAHDFTSGPQQVQDLQLERRSSVLCFLSLATHSARTSLLLSSCFSSSLQQETERKEAELLRVVKRWKRPEPAGAESRFSEERSHNRNSLRCFLQLSNHPVATASCFHWWDDGIHSAEVYWALFLPQAFTFETTKSLNPARRCSDLGNPF